MIALAASIASLGASAMAGVYCIPAHDVLRFAPPSMTGDLVWLTWHALPLALAAVASPAAARACCWFGSVRYAQPLEPAADHRWRALASLGVEMHVIGFSTAARARSFTQHARFHLLPQFPLAPLRHLTMFLLAPWVLLRVCARCRVEVVIAQSPYEAAIAAPVRTLLGWFGRPTALVVESHGDFENALFLYRDVRAAGIYRWVMPRVADFGLRHADAGRAVSTATREQMLSRASSLAVEVFPAWVDVATFGEGERARPVAACQNVLFAGALAPVRGVHLLVDAFARVADAHPAARLVVAGRDENPAYASRLRARTRELRLETRVHWAGHVSPPELARMMGEARVLVLPSVSEGLGRVLLEAMLRGTPVVGSRVGGIPDVIRDGETGYLVPPGDADALAATLLRIFEDPHVAEVGRAAREFARGAVSVDAYVDGHRRLLARAMAALGPRRP